MIKPAFGPRQALLSGGRAGTLVLFAAIAFAACGNKRAEVNIAVGNSRKMEDKAEDVTILYSKGGHVQARLFSRYFIRDEQAKPPFVEMKGGLKVEFFNDSLHLKNTVTARNGRWYEAQGNVVLRDSVHVTNDKGEQLDTDELVWNEEVRKFYTDKPVTITTATQQIFGQGMEANDNFSWYQLRKITGSVLVEKGKLPQ